MIHHLSYPQNQSINSGIPQEESFVQYASVSDAIQFIKQYGNGAFCCKKDIKSAFQIINLHQSQFKFVGLKWRNKFYVDTCLQFGLSSSCKIFERFSTALQWIARNKLGISCISHVLDDFIIVNTSPIECVHQIKAFLSMCLDNGIPISLDKTCGPKQIIAYLGYELDSLRMEARLPQDKISKCVEQLESALHHKKITLNYRFA
jgi:hypothetical protein